MRFFSALPALSSFAAIAAMGLAACMSTQETDTNEPESRKLTERELEAAAGLVKRAAETAAPNGLGVGSLSSQLNQAKEQMRAAGVCEGLIGVIDDLGKFFDDVAANEDNMNFDPSLSQYPNITRMISCVPTLGASADEDALMGSVADFQSFSNCICGGSGSIFGDYDAIARAEWRGFSPAAVTEGGFAPSSASNSGFRPSSTTGFQPSGTGGGFTPSAP